MIPLLVSILQNRPFWRCSFTPERRKKQKVFQKIQKKNSQTNGSPPDKRGKKIMKKSIQLNSTEKIMVVILFAFILAGFFVPHTIIL
jgi:hypothetical protein